MGECLSCRAELRTTAFSMTIRRPIRGMRNLGILGSYGVGLVMFFGVGLKICLAGKLSRKYNRGERSGASD